MMMYVGLKISTAKLHDEENTVVEHPSSPLSFILPSFIKANKGFCGCLLEATIAENIKDDINIKQSLNKFLLCITSYIFTCSNLLCPLFAFCFLFSSLFFFIFFSFFFFSFFSFFLFTFFLFSFFLFCFNAASSARFL